jgi:hypothetical protein
MMKHLSERVLALDVHPLSFGFTVFEGPDHLIDWGVRSFRRGVNAVKVPMRTRLALLINEYRPGILLVVRRTGDSLRPDVIAKVATAHRVRIRALSPDSVKKVFPDSHNKDGIALAVARRLPALSPYIPPKRKPWKPEHYRMSVFAAAAIGLSHFDRMAPKDRSPVAELSPFAGPSVA